MPARRSRTERWKESLERIASRQGGLELTPVRHEDSPPADLLWRVRVLEVTDTEILVERPGLMGAAFHIRDGQRLRGVMSVGQNRWTFSSEVLGLAGRSSGPGGMMRIRVPSSMRREMRREHERRDASTIVLPAVHCRTMTDQASARRAEALSREGSPAVALDPDAAETSPGGGAGGAGGGGGLGHEFDALLLNIGGGGIGVKVPAGQARAAATSGTYLISLDLSPVHPSPITVRAKVAHTHIDCAQDLHLGLAFQFDAEGPHREFVVGKVLEYVERSQISIAA